MFTREAVIAEARSWRGTPWHHQASLKGVGCDCIGFVRGVAKPFVGEVAIPLDYPETWHLYRAEPRMYLGFKEHCEEIAPEDALAADILLFGAGKGPAHHCAYVTPEGGLIHCYREAGKVVEQALTDWWRAKLRHAFRLPGIEDGSLLKSETISTEVFQTSPMAVTTYVPGSEGLPGISLDPRRSAD